MSKWLRRDRKFFIAYMEFPLQQMAPKGYLKCLSGFEEIESFFIAYMEFPLYAIPICSYTLRERERERVMH